MIHSRFQFLAGAAVAALALSLVHACRSSSEGKPSQGEARKESGEEDEDSKDEESVAIANVPEHVRAGAQKYFSDLSTCKASREQEHGAQIFEIVGKGEGGRDVSLNISSAGSVFEVEREIAGDGLPSEVRAALAEHFGGATVKKAEAIELHYYEVRLAQAGKTVEVRISGAGQVMEEEK